MTEPIWHADIPHAVCHAMPKVVGNVIKRPVCGYHEWLIACIASLYDSGQSISLKWCRGFTPTTKVVKHQESVLCIGLDNGIE